MGQNTDHGQRRSLIILLLVFALFLLASPFFRWWAISQRSWYLPYLAWAGIILLIYFSRRR